MLLAASGSVSASRPGQPGCRRGCKPATVSAIALGAFHRLAADGSMLVATRFGETEQLHRVRSPLAMREQLSFDPAGVLTGAAEPEHSDAFVFLAPRAGGQSTALLWQQSGQAAVPLTDGSLRDGPALWAHDGKRIAFSSNRAGGGIDVLDTSDSGRAPEARGRR
jgi:hypothetical protein